MNFPKFLQALAFAWLALACSAAFAAGQVADASPAAVSVDPVSAVLSLDAGVVLLEDPSGRLDLAAVRTLPAQRWQRPKLLPVSLGYSRSAWWLHLRLQNAGDAPLNRFFEVASPLQDYIDLHVVRAGGRVQTFATLGDRVAFDQRPVPSVNPTVPLPLAANETVDLYLRLSTHDGLYEALPLVLWTPKDFREAAQSHWFGSGLYCGLIGLLLIYSSFLFVTTRDPRFAFYAAYLVAQLLWRTVFCGDAFYVLWPDSPHFNNEILPIACGAFFASLAVFLSLQLRLRQHLPRWNRVLLVLGVGSGVASLGAVLDSYAAVFLLTLLFGLLWAVCIYGCGLWLSIRKRHRGARWSLIGWTPLLLTGFGYALQLYGLQYFERLPPMHTALQLAVLAQVLLLGLGVSFDVGRWRDEKFEAERAARLMQENLALRLEGEVRQRTQALEHANTKLREISITDGLTGLYNRRHFNETLDTEMARLLRQGDSPVLCLLDVDHFKSYNDLYGHQKGDAALKAIADVLKAKLRRAGDRAFRVGGEEFALLMLPEEPSLMRRHVEDIRAAIQALGQPHAGNAAGVVTASFGLVQTPPRGAADASFTAAALYREADRLLYLAKEGGRNCVVSDQRPAAEWAPASDFGFEPGAVSSPVGPATKPEAR